MIKKMIVIIAIGSTLMGCNSTTEQNKNLKNATTEASFSTNTATGQVADINYQIMVQRATQTAIWSMPAVGMVDFIKATRRELGGDYNDVVYLSKPFTSRHGFLTANDVTAYAWSNITLKDGPMVIEVPAASDKTSYFGTIVNAWDQPIEDVGPPGADKGKGGKYLIVPPEYKGELPKSGYIIRHTDTHDVSFAFRPRLNNGATDADAAEYAQTIKIYPLKDVSNPTPTNYFDAYNSNYDCLPYYNYTFFEDINDVVQNNPVRQQDKVMISLLKTLGIEKGKPFTPTEEQKRAMEDGLKLAFSSMQDYFINKSTVPLWKGKSQWAVWNFAKGQPQAGFPYETQDSVLVDERAGGSYSWITYLPKYLGGGTFYLTGLRDSDGNMLDGNSTYRLNVPKDTPAKDFWSVIAYSMETKGFIRNQSEVGRSSRNIDEMVVNDDGSYDIYIGAKAPTGMEKNFIPSGGENFFLLFRLYGPETKDFYKTWMLSDLVKVK